MTARLAKIFALVALTGLLCACATLNAEKIADKERLLISAGFHPKYADNRQKLEHLNAQPQHKIITYVKAGKNYYVYADASNCRCMYVGGDRAYQKFTSLQVQQHIAQELQISAELNQNAALNWQMSGGRDWAEPWGYGPWAGEYQIDGF